jgi:hypothetical protein
MEARMRSPSENVNLALTMEIEQDSRFGQYLRCGAGVIQSEAILL